MASAPAPKVFRKARVEAASGLLVDYQEAHHFDSRGKQWDRLLFDNGSHIDIPDESRFGVNFALEENQPYSARWTNLDNGRRGLQLVQGLNAFESETEV